MNKIKPKWLFPLFVIALTIAIFITDIVTPFGLAVWIPYIAVVLISFNTGYKRFPKLIVGIITLFMIFGYLLSPPEINRPIELLNYIIGTGMIWLTFSISYKRKKAEDALHMMFDELEIRVKERTSDLVMTNERLNKEIIEREQVELQLQRNAEELKKANEIKDKFYSIIAHDLRGPFHTFLNVSALLADEIDTLSTEEIKGLSSELNLALKKQYQLLANLLDWTRLQNKSFNLDLETIFLREVLIEVIEPLSYMSKQKGIELINTISDDLRIIADKYMLKLVLHNLISNGIKFTNKNGLIKISAIGQDGSVIINVTDNGIGIAEEDISRLFAKDVRYSTEGTAKEKGTGLGLMLCKEIVEKHGGQISIESEVGKGTKFIFSIPFSKDRINQ
ncbi:MAG: HAMP domain-containing sensor histidine kinase [Ignavibacteriaceae bacterium]|nr:HAMP domain-containing sensor histidine kinase [Ignavibacteriaceae bacterium]